MERTIPLRCALTPNLFQACIMAELRQPVSGAAYRFFSTHCSRTDLQG
jgi:hypothetical protein